MLDDIKKIIRNDSETKNLNIDDSDLLTVYNYILQRDGLSKNSIPTGYTVSLNKSPYFHITYVPTKEKEDEIKANKQKELIDTLGTDNYIMDVDLKDFYTDTDERKKAYDYAMDFIDSYKNKKIRKGMFITGKYRTGKSFLLSAIALKMIEMNASVLYAYCADLSRVLKDFTNRNDLEDKIIALKKCDILILDDLGSENMTPWLRDDCLSAVIQYRMSASLPVFISTNYSLKELVEVLGSTSNEDDRVKALRLVTRIKEMTETFSLTEKANQKILK